MNTIPAQYPFYRIKEKELLYDIGLLRDSLTENWGNFVMGYSFKTNSLPWLLSYLRTQGFYAEVVSVRFASVYINIISVMSGASGLT